MKLLNSSDTTLKGDNSNTVQEIILHVLLDQSQNFPVALECNFMKQSKYPKYIFTGVLFHF